MTIDGYIAGPALLDLLAKEGRTLPQADKYHCHHRAQSNMIHVCHVQGELNPAQLLTRDLLLVPLCSPSTQQEKTT